MLLASRFATQADRRPDEIAVRTATASTSYGALLDQAAAVARAVSPHERIALLPRSDAASLAVVLGAMAAGTSLVLLHRHLTAAQRDRVLADAAPALVVAERPPAVLVDGIAPNRLRSPTALAAAAARPASAPVRSARPEDELLVGLTSGTSGEPKLFARDQASWAATLDRSDATFAVGPGDRVSLPGPLDHTHFLYGALHALTRGATVDLRPLEAAFASGSAESSSPSQAPTPTPTPTPTHVYLVPTLAVALLEALDGRPRPELRQVLSSAAAWPDRARRQLGRLLPQATISHFYGASELSFVALDDSRTPGPPGTAGRPFAGVEIEIRDPETGVRSPAGEPGEIHVRSDMLFSGYLAADGLSGRPDADGWVTVGDLGTLRGGWLSIAGRRSDTIVSGGLNVEPGEVEAALVDLPGVAEVACVGLPDERWGAVPVAVLVLDPDADPASAPDRAAVRRRARATLAQPSRPRRVFLLGALPRNPRGKLLRATLVEQIRAGVASEVT